MASVPHPATAALPSVPGTYVLILCVESAMAVQVGRLGTFHFPAGWYAYVGSAFGRGGLGGRIRHHLAPARQLHWHIDWFRTASAVREVWYAPGVASEHDWAGILLALPTAFVPAPRFGASDCTCASHLIGFPDDPPFLTFTAQAGTPPERLVIARDERGRRPARSLTP